MKPLRPANRRGLAGISQASTLAAPGRGLSAPARRRPTWRPGAWPRALPARRPASPRRPERREDQRVHGQPPLSRGWRGIRRPAPTALKLTPCAAETQAMPLRPEIELEMAARRAAQVPQVNRPRTSRRMTRRLRRWRRWRSSSTASGVGPATLGARERGAVLSQPLQHSKRRPQAGHCTRTVASGPHAPNRRMATEEPRRGGGNVKRQATSGTRARRIFVWAGSSRKGTMRPTCGCWTRS